MQILRIFLGDSLYYIFTFLFFTTTLYICNKIIEVDINKDNKDFTIEELEWFLNDTIDQFHTRPDEDPLTVEMIIKALKGFIDLKKK